MTPRDSAPRNVLPAAVLLTTFIHGLAGHVPHWWAQGPAAPEAAPAPQRMIAAHPALAKAPRRTRTVRGHVGDPINVAFIGSDREFHHALARAGWYAADPITL